MQAAEYGPNSRGDLRLPFYFREMDTAANNTEHSAEVVSIATWSFIMRSPIPLKVGSVISIRMRIPVEISGSVFQDMRGIGRVVSECALENGVLGYHISMR